ncbi:hypothetical protein D3C87_249730 [compost metagenome]
MSKAQEYGLSFTILQNKKRPYPTIICETSQNGTSVNKEIVSFLEDNGIRYTQDIIDEINSYTSPIINGYSIFGGNSYESVEIFSPPPRAVFNKTGTEVEIPLNDFLEILEEWKKFLQELTFDHRLSKY